MADSKRLTAEEAKAKADECRELAQRTGNTEHRKIFGDMAQGWDEIARTLQRAQSSNLGTAT